MNDEIEDDIEDFHKQLDSFTPSDKKKWLVSIDRSYYPSVRYFEIQKQAEEFFNQAVIDENSSGGSSHDITITISQMTLQARIKGDY